MDYRIEIQKVDNGYILTDHTNVETDLDTDDKIESITDPRVSVFEKDSKCNREHVVNLLYEILDIFGEFGSKHDDHRIIIRCKCDKDI